MFAGTSGWAYPTWKPGFYPGGTSAKRFLNYYASKLNAVEVNYTFRKLPTQAMLEGWMAETGADFRFCFKAPQGITHFKRLKDCDESLALFFKAIEPARAAGRLGLVLFQLPPNFKLNVERLAVFLAAAADAAQGVPLAFEFRHESWFCEEIYALLRMHAVALCVAMNDELETPEVHTAPTHTSFRLRHTGGYKPARLKDFAKKMSALAADRTVYTFFKHEDEPTGALNATAFLQHVKRGRKPAA